MTAQAVSPGITTAQAAVRFPHHGTSLPPTQKYLCPQPQGTKPGQNGAASFYKDEALKAASPTSNSKGHHLQHSQTATQANMLFILVRCSSMGLWYHSTFQMLSLDYLEHLMQQQLNRATQMSLTLVKHIQERDGKNRSFCP